jgi:hypothetical protein
MARHAGVDFGDLGNSKKGRTYIAGEEVVALLRRIEWHRQELTAEAALFKRWLTASPQLQAVWTKFIDAGGITAREFDRFLDGLPFRHRRVRQHRHLRLVARNITKPHLLRRSGVTK